MGPALMGISGELAGYKNREDSPTCLEKAHGKRRALQRVTTAQAGSHRQSEARETQLATEIWTV